MRFDRNGKNKRLLGRVGWGQQNDHAVGDARTTTDIHKIAKAKVATFTFATPCKERSFKSDSATVLRRASAHVARREAFPPKGSDGIACRCRDRYVGARECE